MLDRGQNVLWKWLLLLTISVFLAGIFSFGCGSKGDEAIIARVNGEALVGLRLAASFDRPLCPSP